MSRSLAIKMSSSVSRFSAGALPSIVPDDHVPVSVDESHIGGGGIWEGRRLKQLQRLGVGEVDRELTTADDAT